jgi:hypothetical protein
MSAMASNLDIHGKALSLNLDGSIYGTFAEIGAGQEVARCFLGVGAASGTVAKTISAYDKQVSDDIYGAGTRYVSKERLLAMLDHEYELVLQRLSRTKGESTRFFAFADTVAARNYKGDNEQHGWIGIRFQSAPASVPSHLLLHTNLRDPSAHLQQQAVGTLGVNLVYAAFHQIADCDSFLSGLFNELSSERIEIDVIEFDGPAFINQDERTWCLALLRRQMACALVFSTDGRVVEPSSVLRKRPIVVMRGTFSHPELVDTSLLVSARDALLTEGESFERAPVALLEVSTRHVTDAREVSVDNMLAFIAQATLRWPLIVSDYPETYLLSRYLRRYSVEPVRFVLSVAAAAKIMHASFYRTLPGTLLEGLGKLLAANVRLYVSPMPRQAFMAAFGDMSATPAIRASAASADALVGLDDLEPASPVCYLLEYLRASGRVVPLPLDARGETRKDAPSKKAPAR